MLSSPVDSIHVRGSRAEADMSDDDNKSGKWTLYPPGMPGKMGMPEHLEKPMKVEVKDTYTALKDLADIINGSQLTRVEVDEFQLGICFTSEIHIRPHVRLRTG
jgi:hypothetical protein